MSKKITFEALVSTLQVEYPGVVKMGSELLPIEKLSTGIDALDLLLQGGWPKGRIIQIAGPMKTGKTTLALYAARALSPCLYIDSERKFDPTYAQLLGVDLDQTIVLRPETLEECFTIIFQVLAKCPLASIILDSLTALIPNKELLESDMSKTTAISPIAVILSRKLPIIVSKIAQTGTIFLIINQMRDKINAGPFQNPYSVPGGHQLKGLTSLSLVTGNKGKIKDSALGDYGQTFAVMVDKSSIGRSNQRTEINYIDGVGFTQDLIATTNQLRIDAGKKPKRVTVIEEVNELEEELNG